MFLKVKALKDYTLELYLNDNSKKIFDMKPYLNLGDFKRLQDWELFKTVHIDELNGIEWDCYNLSLSRDTIIANML